MSTWTIEPRDPLVVRDGRPNNGRSESAALPFPYPSTIAGIVRTRLGSDERGVFELTQEQDLKALRCAAIRGPLLARLAGGGFYVPRPRDAVVMRIEATGKQVLRRLAPIHPGAGALFEGDPDLAPVGLAREHALSSGKSARSRAWWPWDTFSRWLAEPDTLDGGDADTCLKDGLFDLPVEARSHVKLTETWTAEEGMLFQTRGLRLTTEDRGSLALAVDINPSTTGGRTLRAGVGPCGGERRLAYWQSAPALSLPALPRGVRTALAAEVQRVCVRVVLLTPAIFVAGWKPGNEAATNQLLARRCDVTPKLVAACVPRAETISGWDFAKGQPKATRRLVSAGSVYWIDLEGTPADRVRWAEAVMMQNVSDAEQDRLDGFGLAAVGVGP